MNYILGIDAGGTFIDYFLIDERGTTYSGYKSLAQPSVSDYGIMDGLIGFAQYLNIDIKDFIANIKLIIHGTTVTTNAVLTRRGAKTALLTTEGLIDLLEMRQGVREDVYNNNISPPKPLVDRWLRVPIKERIDYQGNVISALDENLTQQQLTSLLNMDIESMAIVLAHSYVNPTHEHKLSAIVKSFFPNIHISLSSQVLPKPHMYRRLSTTVLDAYVAPVLKEYLEGLGRQLNQWGFKGDLLIMQSNGGTLKVEESLQIPVMSILSGPAAGPNLVNLVAEDAAHKDYIVMDMGGTSFDISLIRKGTPSMRENSSIAGHFIGLPIIDIHTIGAGGGSIAWIDNGSLLHVGPCSAGAFPGPACYDLGGSNPTITDVNLILGLINPDYFLGGRIALNYQKAWDAIHLHIAQPLNIDVYNAAIGIYKMVNTEMVGAIKEITFERGFDPSDMSLVVGGGAGLIHAAYIANQLGMEKLIIPRESSVMCALGMLYSGYRRNYYQHFNKNLENITTAELETIYGQLWQRALKQVVADQNITMEKKQIYMRYQGQHFDLLIDLDQNQELSREGLKFLFHKKHLDVYGYNLEELGTGIEVVGLAITVKGDTFTPSFEKKPTSSKPKSMLKGSRIAYFDELGDFIEVPVYDGDNMGAGYKLSGPALVEQRHTTVVVPSNYIFICESDKFIMRRH
ncbi:MAG: hydantoinase/oxoprolinase family protein [Syntrophomonadaceae bacterium]|nr:hydantoinase/oxoprolinase family protein [Syntrophomonadaceae bacterium]